MLMNEPLTAIIIGATGLIGTELVKQLAESKRYGKVILLVRSPLPSLPSGVEYRVINFNEPHTYPVFEGALHLFCAMGTTIKKAGSQEAFKQVDFTYVVNLAQHFRNHGATHFIAVSAIGADPNANIFYSRIKGETEQALMQLNFPQLTLLRPSMLGGNRTEFRLGERVATLILKLIQWTFVGGLRRYRIVYDRDVAAAMITASRRDGRALEIIESEQIPGYQNH
jgi:uncharacterized protein YbjT (DUF2867 family)